MRRSESAPLRGGPAACDVPVPHAVRLGQIPTRGTTLDVHEQTGLDPCEGPETRPAVVFSPVRIDKLVVLSLLTWGAYEIVWLYRNWRAVKRAERSAIWPVARALFGPVFYYALLKRLDVRARAGLVLAYWLLIISYRLPDPWSFLCAVSFLALLPAAVAVNRANGEAGRNHPSFRWRPRSAVVAVLGLILMPFVGIGIFGPSSAVVPGASMSATDIQYLLETGLLDDDEEILFFYSAGVLSIRSDGVFASDKGITSYWKDPVSEELVAAYLSYAEIVDVEINWSSHFFDDTVVRVTGSDDSWFIFTLSAESGGDRLFLEEVERRRNAVPRGRIIA